MKLNLKSAAAIRCAAAMAFFTGCKQDSGKIRIGVSIPSADHGWTGGVVWWAEQAKKDLESKDPNLEIIITTAKDSAEQVSRIENLMAQGIKALVVLPHECLENPRDGGAWWAACRLWGHTELDTTEET